MGMGMGMGMGLGLPILVWFGKIQGPVQWSVHRQTHIIK